MNDFFKQREAIERMADPLKGFREQREAIERMADPLKGFREQREAIERMADPLKGFREQREAIERMADPLKGFREQREAIERMADPLKGFREQREAMEHLVDPLKKLREYREKWLRISQSLNNEIGAIHNLEGEGLISISGDIVDANRLSGEIYSISSSSSDFEEFNKRLLEWFQLLSKGAKIFALYILLPYITSVVGGIHTPMWTGYWNDYSKLPKRIAKKEIVKDAKELFNSSELSQYRFTTASKLRVRQEGSIKSQKVNSLPFGTVVRILDQCKDWTLVEYLDSNTQELKEGWVFSRYLDKFRK